MAEIKEKLTLVDRFSSRLGKFISMMSRAQGSCHAAQTATRQFENTAAAAASSTNATAVSLKNYESVSNSLQKKLVNLNSQWDALIQEQESMVSAGQQGTAAFASLDEKIVQLAGDLQNTEAKLSSVNRQMGLATQSSSSFSADMSGAKVSIAALTQKVDRLEAEIRQLKNAYQQAGAATEQASKKQNVFSRTLERCKAGAQGLLGNLKRLGGHRNSVSGLIGQFSKLAVAMFSVTRIIQALKTAMENAPVEVQESWESLSSSLTTTVFGFLIAALQALQPHFDRLNAALNSPAGQKFAAGLIMIGNLVGTVIGYAIDAIAMLVEFIGNNFATVMNVAVIALALYAAYMLASAAATLAAAWPLLLIVAIVAAVVIALKKLGVTSEQIFTAIGMMAGWLYALVYNLIADAWNIIAVFAEFFANVFNDPVGAVARLFFGVFDSILGIVESVAGAIDALLQTDMAGAVSGFRDQMQSWVDDKFGANVITVERMDKIDYTATMNSWGKKGGEIGKGLDEFEFNVGDILGSVGDLSAISGGAVGGGAVGGIGDSVGGSLGSDVADIKKEVAMSEEELKSLVDMAERKYVNNINLTAQTPVINVTGQNTGNSAADRKALANAIRDMLLKQQAEASLRSTARVK